MSAMRLYLGAPKSLKHGLFSWRQIPISFAQFLSPEKRAKYLISKADVAELVDARDLKNALRLLKGLIFFGRRDLTFGINLPERSEIWKTFLGASDGPYRRHAVRGHAHCARVALALPPHRLHIHDAERLDTNERYSIGRL